MRQPLSEFIAALRLQLPGISTSEVLDAYGAAGQIGVADRDAFRMCLRMTLVKDAANHAEFDAVFDRFFHYDLPDEMQGETAQTDGSADAPSDAPDAGAAEGPPPETGVPLADLVLQQDMTALAQAFAVAASSVGTNRMQTGLQRGIMSRRMLEQMGIEQLEQLIAQLNASGEDEELAEQLTQGRSQLVQQARAFLDRSVDLYADPRMEQLTTDRLEVSNFRAISPQDRARVAQIVRRMAKELASRHSVRHKAAKRGTLDIRRTMRANMAHDGIPYDLRFKRRPRHRTRVVAICDVSGSVAAAAGFLLTFLYSLNEVIPDIHSFAFSGEALDIGDMISNQGIEEAVPQILKRLGMQSTNYGEVLSQICTHHLPVFNRHTVVIILGDARSNYMPARPDLMRLISARSQQVIWLNPENPASWGTGDSDMEVYRTFCDKTVQCASLRQLERVIDEILSIAIG